LGHVNYEIEMLVGSAYALLERPSDRIAANAFVESIAAHTRCLVDL